MPDPSPVPPEAATAADAKLMAKYGMRLIKGGFIWDALEAAAPAIRSEAVTAERQRIVSLMRKVGEWAELDSLITDLTGDDHAA